MADYLSEEIIASILQRLHVKTLLRCTCVCKSWYALIRSGNFISSHLNFTSASEKDAALLLIRRCVGDSESYSLHSDGESHQLLKFPFRSVNTYYTIIGACNGLLCLSDDWVYYMHTIILWNPSIRKSVILPKPNLIYNSHGTFVQSFGFGFDPIRSDYKLVRITYVDNSRERPQVEIFRLSTGFWQDISFVALDCVVYNRSQHAYANFATHWIARSIRNGNLILSFDMVSEAFQEILMPSSLANLDSCVNLDVVSYGESIGVMSRAGPEFCFWVMKEYADSESWMKIFKICLEGGVIMRPIWVRRGNREVLVIGKDGHLVCYTVDGEEVEDLGIGGGRCEDHHVRSVFAEKFVETLALHGKFDDTVISERLPVLKGTGLGSFYGHGSESGVKSRHQGYKERRVM